MQSLIIKELILLELQITQTRYPKSVADGRTEGGALLDLLSQVFGKITMKVKLAKCIRATNVNKGTRFASEVR